MIDASFEAVIPKAINAEFEAIIPREKAFDIVNKDIHIDTNGKYEVKADAGTAMTEVKVEVDVNPYNAVIEYADDTIYGAGALKNVTIREGVKSIWKYALYYAENIDTITVPSSVEYFGNDAFAYSSVRRLNIDGVKVLGLRMCYYCTNLEEINIPEGVEEVPERAFAACSGMKKVVIPTTLKKMGSYSFYSVNADFYISQDTWKQLDYYDAKFGDNRKMYLTDDDKTITIEGTKSVSDRAFSRFVNATGLILSDEVEEVGDSSFEYCGFTTVVAPSVKTIKQRAFIYCSNLEDVDVSNVEIFGFAAFEFCPNISVPIHFNPLVNSIPKQLFASSKKVPYFDFRAFNKVPTLESNDAFPRATTIVVPDALYDQWIVATNWATYASRIVKASEFVEPTNN